MYIPDKLNSLLQIIESHDIEHPFIEIPFYATSYNYVFDYRVDSSGNPVEDTDDPPDSPLVDKVH